MFGKLREPHAAAQAQGPQLVGNRIRPDDSSTVDASVAFEGSPFFFGGLDTFFICHRSTKICINSLLTLNLLCFTVNATLNQQQ